MERNNQNIDVLLEVAISTAKKAGALLRESVPTVLSSIGKDIKLTADIEAHTLISNALEETSIPILSEEDGNHTYSEGLTWIVDPLDGSLNYMRGIPSCVVSIALFEDNKPILGVVYDFNRDEVYTGVVGNGAWLNGVPMHVSDVQEKKNGVIMSGFPSYADYSSDALSAYITQVQEFKKVRLIGSAALSLAYVASGKADVYYERSIKLWDVAAGLALVSAAGGIYRSSKVDDSFGYEITAANHSELVIQ